MEGCVRPVKRDACPAAILFERRAATGVSKPPTPNLRCRARLSFPPPGHRIA